MKIIHTADIHLSENNPERIEALKEIISICVEEEADLLLISGDLFDKNIDAGSLKTDVRPFFSDNDFDTLVIPGNHDESAFREEDYFGDDIYTMTDTPISSRDYGDLNIVGVPYTEEGFSELIEPLSEEVEDDKINLLMIHCTLSGISGGFGEETKYMPVRPEELIQTGFDYMFSGHIHSKATRKDLGEATFTYPGSPVSISNSETGRRHVWIFDTEDEKLKTRKLDTFHYLQRDIELLPDENQKIEEVIEDLRDKDLEKASISIEISGFTDKDIQEITENLEKRLEGLKPAEVEVKNSDLESMASVVESEIYIEFKDKMDEKDLEKPEKIERKFLRALSRHDRS